MRPGCVNMSQWSAEMCIRDSNIPVQADISGDMDLLTFYKQYLKQTYHKPGDAYLGLVHRLDRPTGCLLYTSRCV